jgi:hypothetical protein
MSKPNCDEPEGATTVKPKRSKKMGRPTKYRRKFARQARIACECGATDRDLAELFEVSIRTIHYWKRTQKAFAMAMRIGKAVADDAVERSLYHQALGYRVDAVKIFMPKDAKEPVYAPYREYVRPSVNAALKWLCTRRPDRWRE